MLLFGSKLYGDLMGRIGSVVFVGVSLLGIYTACARGIQRTFGEPRYCQDQRIRTGFVRENELGVDANGDGVLDNRPYPVKAVLCPDEVIYLTEDNRELFRESR